MLYLVVTVEVLLVLIIILIIYDIFIRFTIGYNWYLHDVATDVIEWWWWMSGGRVNNTGMKVEVPSRYPVVDVNSHFFGRRIVDVGQ